MEVEKRKQLDKVWLWLGTESKQNKYLDCIKQWIQKVLDFRQSVKLRVIKKLWGLGEVWIWDIYVYVLSYKDKKKR